MILYHIINDHDLRSRRRSRRHRRPLDNNAFANAFDPPTVAAPAAATNAANAANAAGAQQATTTAFANLCQLPTLEYPTATAATPAATANTTPVAAASAAVQNQPWGVRYSMPKPPSEPEEGSSLISLRLGLTVSSMLLVGLTAPSSPDA